MLIYSLFILLYIFASSLALDVKPLSCNAGASSLFKELLSNFTVNDELHRHYVVFIPSHNNFLDQLELNNHSIRDEVIKSHIIGMNSSIYHGTYLTLNEHSVRITLRNNQINANGFVLTPCSFFGHHPISFYTFDGLLKEDKCPKENIIFRNFRIPTLNTNQLEILKEFGPKFYEHWIENKNALEDPNFNFHESIILVPNDEEVTKVDKNKIIQLLASQVIPIKGGFPDHLTESTTNIHLKNLMGEDVHLILREDSIIVNGFLAKDNSAINYTWDELHTAFVPDLNEEMIQVLNQMKLYRFLSIWRDVKFKSQTQYAKTKENLCALPKDPGPCRFNIAMFYFDGEICRPFVFGGCEGNLNRFNTLRECTESCVHDPVKKRQSFDDIYCLVTTKRRDFVILYMSISSLSCLLSESLFEEFKDCKELCNDYGQITSQSLENLSKKQFCEYPGFCNKTSSVSRIKWIHKDGKCFPLKTDCMDYSFGIYDFEVDCLKSCKNATGEVLTIFAPTDEAIERLLERIGQDSSIFRLHADLAKKFILPHLIFEKANINRPYVLEQKDFRIVLLHEVVTIDTIKFENRTSSFLRSAIERERFVPFNGLPEFREEYLRKNKFVNYNIVYESIYKLLNTRVFNLIHKVISISDSETNENINGRNATARGFCRQELSHGVQNDIVSKNTTRYFYNYDVGSCQSFQFSGIGGNSNNFYSYTECSDFCGKFEGVVSEVKVDSKYNISGHALLIQSNKNQKMYMDAIFEGLKPKTNYLIEAGLTEIKKIESSDLGSIIINEQIDDVHLFGPDTNTILNNKMIIREFNGSSTDSKIVGHGSILSVPNFMEAHAKIIHEKNDQIKGDIILRQDGPFAPVSMIGTVEGVMEGLHGFHIHEVGDTSNECKGAGSHFNPHEKTHGAPQSESRHVGDLGNVQVYWGKQSSDTFRRTIVIHERKDDLGLTGDFSSLTTGNAGSRIACGIIKNAENKKGKIFFIPNDHVMRFIFEEMALQVTMSLREFAYCHYSAKAFDFSSSETNYTTECGFNVNIKNKNSKTGYEMTINGVRAEKVIRDGKNTFFVIPFILYINHESLKKETKNQGASFKKYAHIILPSAEESYGEHIYLRKQHIELQQESPQSTLRLSARLEPLISDMKEKVVQVRIVNKGSIYPLCPPFENDTSVDLGFQTISQWSSSFNINTNQASLYGPYSIIGKILVFYDEDRPLICGRIQGGEYTVDDYNSGDEEVWIDIAPLRLPRQDAELKARASELEINLFFDAWDNALKNGVAVTSNEVEDITLATMTDKDFNHLMPRRKNRSSHACNQDLLFQRKLLSLMIIPGKYDRSTFKDKELIIPNTLEGHHLMFSVNEEDSVSLRHHKSIRSVSTNSTMLYLTSRSGFMNSALFGPHDVFGSFDRANYRNSVIHTRAPDFPSVTFTESGNNNSKVELLEQINKGGLYSPTDFFITQDKTQTYT
ncbi:SOD1 [Lepeophtheirus salmonis]|uniref:SOD1 n=1 Tax=Lepeophtheirus salmonis TaxID=72036 RepID=A0A7R8CYL2_LEPSM|nr:SOD1 [Lepeophtheirus salmonis]CAF2942281.1 SOD1 [Lepeophtheirus salmonis]